MLSGLLSACTISFGALLASNYEKPIKYVSLNNQSYQARPTLVDVNSTETLFIHLILVLINVVDVGALLMIHMMECVFQIK